MSAKLPIIKKGKNEIIQNSIDSIDFFFNLQDNIKLFLSAIIILNFIIILIVKFLTNVNKKIQNFFLDEIRNANSINDKNISNKKEKEETNSKEKKFYDILFITAHPDDEVMFFSPTIKLLTQKIEKERDRFNVRILCLSNGNYDKLGKLREDEFSKVMKKLNINNYTIIDDENMKDDINKFWDSDLIAEKINNYLSENNNEAFTNISHIITFDEYGVTHHPNHISCYYGLE